PFFPENKLVRGEEVIVMSGIGNPKAFVRDVRREYKVVAKMILPDHHIYNMDDINNLVALFAKYPNAKLLTTEKDAVKLRRSKRVPQIVRERMFYQPLKVEFLEGSDADFFSTLKDDLDGKIHLGDLKITGENN
ncbi:MAG: tetraacyldisaccharide 4'-kinase, partial [Alistipes sp.]|nr:tetraacyldisaccharide 4'-kinase [Alistipes sp.]